MKIVFLSNYYNHHQSKLSEALYQEAKGNYIFIETEKMSEERREMGWGEKNIPEYVKQSFTGEEDYKDCLKDIMEADVVLYGCAPYQMIVHRMKKNKLVFFYSERIHKFGYNYFKLLKHIPLFYFRYGRYKNTYCLCASAYTAYDYSKTFTFLNKTYKWGYFPEYKEYSDIIELINNKKTNSILWCARFIDWKHPEIPILLAEHLKNSGYNFHIKMIGSGKKFEQISLMIEKKNLNKYVSLIGAVYADDVRHYMEEAELFLFTSDFGEGWGAVLNESMNSGCAVVASHAIGAVPYLMKDNENGIIYRNGDLESLFNKVKFLLDNPTKRKEMGVNAYNTIKETWNAKVAASRFVKLCEMIERGKVDEKLFIDGPCSRARILRNGWYK